MAAEATDGTEATDGQLSWSRRVFGSRLFFRLWCAQVVSAMGDWIGFLAIAAAATRVGGGSPATAVGLVMSARIAPGFFLGPAAGVLVDRWDRRKLMVVCDVGRALTLACLPFITHVWHLLVASLVLEIFTMLWSPAKEASVPNLVPADRLTSANSLSLAAAYGTFPLAALVFALLAKVAQTLGHFHAVSWLGIRQESVAFWFDAATFLVSASLIWRLTLPSLSRDQRRAAHEDGTRWTQAFAELKEGWRFIFMNPVVRAVNLGLACGLIGGGMLVPLGPVFSDEVLGAGAPGFGLLTTGLGFGVAGGVFLLTVFQQRIPKARVFTIALVVAGVSLLGAASMSSLTLAVVFAAMLGVCAGSVYVLGFTLLHENVSNELRGRIFSALYTLVRLCVLVAFAIGPLLSGLLDKVSAHAFHHSRIEVGGFSVFVPGVRLTLWLAGLIILGASALAIRSMKKADLDHAVAPVPAETPADQPAAPVVDGDSGPAATGSATPAPSEPGADGAGPGDPRRGMDPSVQSVPA